MDEVFDNVILHHEVLEPGKEALASLQGASEHTATHNHKNFTVLGLLVHYIAGLLAFAAVSSLVLGIGYIICKLHDCANANSCLLSC